MDAEMGWDLKCNNKKCGHVFTVRSVRTHIGIRCPACQKTSQYRTADFKHRKSIWLRTTRLGLGSELLKEPDEKETPRGEQIQDNTVNSAL